MRSGLLNYVPTECRTFFSGNIPPGMFLGHFAFPIIPPSFLRNVGHPPSITTIRQSTIYNT